MSREVRHEETGLPYRSSPNWLLWGIFAALALTGLVVWKFGGK